MKRSIKLVLATLAVTLFATSTFAVTVASTNTNNISATVIAGCKWVTPLTVTFGNYSPVSGAALSVTTTVSFQCTKLSNATNAYKVWFSKTSGNMQSGANPDLLAYTLTDGSNNPLPTTAATATGTGVTGTAGVAAGAGYSFTVKGNVAGGQDVSAYAAPYTDTVTANVEY